MRCIGLLRRLPQARCLQPCRLVVPTALTHAQCTHGWFRRLLPLLSDLTSHHLVPGQFVVRWRSFHFGVCLSCSFSLPVMRWTFIFSPFFALQPATKVLLLVLQAGTFRSR